MPVYIPDGYTMPFHIPAVAGLYGDLRGHFRPMVREDVDEMFERCRGKKAREIVIEVSRSLDSRVIDWDLHDPDGQLVEKKPENLRRLPPAQFDLLQLIVIGGHAPLPDGETPSAGGAENLVEGAAKN